MSIRKERVLSFLYSKSIRTDMLLIANSLIDPTTKLQLSYRGNCNSAYTAMSGKDKDIFRIVIGGGMVAQGALLPDLFSDKAALKPYLGPIKVVFKALNYHELGHVLFTDMSFTELLKYNERYQGFVFQLFNILEDPVIELKVIKYVETTRPYDKSPRAYIDYLKKQLFSHQCKEYKDNGKIEAFLQYLLLILRCGKDAITGTNAVYEKYKKDLSPQFKDILMEPDAAQRQAKTVKLADWIINNIKEFSWEEVTAPEDMRPKLGGIRVPGLRGGMPGGGSSGEKSSELSESDIPDIDGKISGGSSGKSEGAEEGEGGDKDGSKSKKDGKRKKDEGEADDEKSEESEKPEELKEAPSFADDVAVDECFDDLLNASYSHEFVIAKDEYIVTNPEYLEQQLNDQLAKTHDCVQDIAKFLTLFNGRKKPRNVGGFTSGKLNIRAAMQDEARDGCEIKLFDRRVPRGKMADLAVSLVCDNSGSMIGRQSRLASIAALALAQACEWSKIPFECSCFTKTSDDPSGTSITIIEKSFDDTFQRAKPFFGINDSELVHCLSSERRIPTFYGNSEEVNLYHIGNAFARCGHQTKLMFVFCDGCTTGSKANLRQVVANMEKMGIVVIGIGLCADEVANVYPNHKIFNSSNDIRDNLAPYLVDTLSKFATTR